MAAFNAEKPQGQQGGAAAAGLPKGLKIAEAYELNMPGEWAAMWRRQHCIVLVLLMMADDKIVVDSPMQHDWPGCNGGGRIVLCDEVDWLLASQSSQEAL